MGFGTVSDPFVAAALWTGCGAFAASLSLLGAIAILRLRLLRRLSRERRIADLWNPLIAECALRAPERPPKIAVRDAPAVLLLWVRAQETLRGEAYGNLVELARRSEIPQHAHRLLRSARPHLELLAIVVFGHLRERSVIELLTRLVGEAPSLGSLTAAHALLRIDEPEGIQRLLQAVPRREDWALAQTAAILGDAEPALVGPHLAAAIRAELRTPRPGPGLAQLLRLHGLAHSETIRDSVLEVLASTAEPEALAAALGALWHPADAAHARRLLGHDAWAVRVAAARALRKLGGREDLPALAGLLSDRSWWVRHRAAEALCSLPGIGRDELQQLHGSLKDHFAADALAQALADTPP